MDTEQLVRLHRRSSPALSNRPETELLLWYADLNLCVSGENVEYRCPECGTGLIMALEEFLERDSSEDLRCDDCRGELAERGGAMY